MIGARSGFVLDGPNPFEAFGGSNPALLGPTAVAGCPTGVLSPDTAARSGVNSAAPILALAMMLLLAAVGLGIAVGRRSQAP